ncbi:hypothetical protein ACFOPN_06330 [Xanthomonas hyacinthi]|uniref:hypothetical protein n=1 Tax=Xanthomonas hyacinthi TaxID=56455 RepID=UPI003618C89F
MLGETEIQQPLHRPASPAQTRPPRRAGALPDPAADARSMAASAIETGENTGCMGNPNEGRCSKTPAAVYDGRHQDPMSSLRKRPNIGRKCLRGCGFHAEIPSTP